MNQGTKTQTTFERRSAIFMAIACAICLLAVAGWLFDRPILASLLPEYIPMAPATGLIFLGLCGTWFIHRKYSSRRWIRRLTQAGMVGMLIIVLILALNYFTGLGPNLEQLLYPNPALLGNILTARMSPLTALGFFLAIPAFLLLTGGKPGTRSKRTSVTLSLVVLLLGGLNIFGYLYGAPLFYGGRLIPVAITTALSFLFLSLGLLMTAGPSCWPVRLFVGASLKVRLMRTLIPASILIVMLQGLLSTDSAPWIINPALRVAFGVLVASLIVLVIISLIAKNLGTEFEHGQQSEEALRQSEAELRALFASMHDVVMVIDCNGIYRKIAPTNPELLVRPPQDLLGKTLRDVFPSEQAETLLKVLQEVVDTKQTAQIEYDLVIGKLTVRFETSISPMTEDSTLWVARDITERKQTEEALMESSARFRTLFEASPDSLLLIDPHDRWRILDCNSTACQMNGYTHDELVGQSIDILNLTPGDPTERADYLERILQNNVLRLETLHRRKDGTVFPVEVSTSIIKLGGREVVLGIDRDITERKLAEQNLRESESRFHAIFELAAIGVAEINSRTGKFVRVNQKYCDIFGFSREDMLRMRFQEISHPDDLPDDLEQMQKLLDGEIHSFSMEKRHYRSDQSIIWLNLTVSPLWAPGEQPDFHMAVIEDITERKNMEEEIRNLSLTDELTGLYNRRGFTLLAEQEMKLAQRFKRNVLLFFCDVDDLKMINDTLGHTHGDLALKEVATILKGVFREADIPARYGGDEFVVLAPDSSMENADILINRLQGALDAHNQKGDRPYQLTLSMGIARYDPKAPCTVGDLIAQADGRMYEQKQAKKGKK
jgi:diguanylate cyclase (GGDEF)-like protein/PAS domain S-box-containing protein